MAFGHRENAKSHVDYNGVVLKLFYYNFVTARE